MKKTQSDKKAWIKTKKRLRIEQHLMNGKDKYQNILDFLSLALFP